MSERPYIVKNANKGSSPSVYHSGPDCNRIKTDDPHRVGYRFVKARDLRECHACAGRCDTDRSDARRPLRRRIEAGEVVL